VAYTPEAQSDLINESEKRLNRDVVICRAVKETVEGDGWKNTIAPLIDKMIIDIVGGKIADVWASGKLDRAKKEERREFYIGYKQALIDLHGRVMSHLVQLPMLEDRLKELQKEKEGRFRVPLVDDERYGGDKYAPETR
jgi:hypothetical protein